MLLTSFSYEMDILLETNSNTIRRVEEILQRMEDPSSQHDAAFCVDNLSGNLE